MFIAVLVLFGIELAAQENKGVVWEEGSLASVLAKAKKSKTKKLVFVDCYASWCGPCKSMANIVFPTEEAGKYFNANFFNVKFDMEKGEGVEIKKNYRIKAFPTFLILDEKGNEIGRVVGGDELDSFIEKVERAKDTENSPSKKRKDFDKEKTVEHAAAYFKVLDEAYMKDDMNAFANELLESFKPNQLLSGQLWPYVCRQAGFNDKFQKFLLENKSDAVSIYGADNVNSLLIKDYTNKLYYYLRGNSFYGDIRPDTSETNVRGWILAERLLSAKENVLDNLCADLAEMRLDGRGGEMAGLFRYNLYNRLGFQDLYNVEWLFLGLREISSSDIEKYYNHKELFLNNNLKGAKTDKERYLKRKAENNL